MKRSAETARFRRKTRRIQYSEPVRSRFVKLEDEFIREVQKMPDPTDAEATQYLEDVIEDAWSVMNEVKADLITKVSENTVLATNTR